MINRSAKELDNNMEIHLHDCRLKIGKLFVKSVKKGYNQEQLADIMNVSRTTISKIENGKFNFSIDYLSKFSWFLDFNISILTNRK